MLFQIFFCIDHGTAAAAPADGSNFSAAQRDIQQAFIAASLAAMNGMPLLGWYGSLTAGFVIGHGIFASQFLLLLLYSNLAEKTGLLDKMWFVFYKKFLSVF